MPDTIVDILHRCRMFRGVDDDGFQRLTFMARLRKFKKGQIIFREGDPCPGTYVVGSGVVRVYKTGIGGKEHVLHIVEPGQTFAEVASIAGFDCPANAEAIVPTSCALLPTDLLQKALREEHSLCLGMMSGMAGWVRHLIGLMEDIVLRDAAGRVARYLLESTRDSNGLIELPGLKRHVASHLNLTSETFSRVLRRLLEAGFLAEQPGNRLQVVDAAGLASVTDGLYPRI